MQIGFLALKTHSGSTCGTPHKTFAQPCLIKRYSSKQLAYISPPPQQAVILMCV